MRGLVVRKSDKEVLLVLEDLTEVVGNNIYFAGGAAEGINLDEADIYVVDVDVVVGDILGNVANHKAAFTKPSPEQKAADQEQRMADMEMMLAELLFS